MNRFTDKVLQVAPESPYARFERIVVHDETSFGVKSGLQDVFPGQFTAFKPAAVELHASYDLLRESLEQVTLIPDSEAEVHHVPASASLAGCLLLPDRMFFVREYLLDMEDAWRLSGKRTLTARLIVTWDQEQKCPRYLATSLSRTDFSIKDVIEGYRWRWQIELLFKEWKSYANLHAFDTNNPYIAEGLIWTSLCVALLKRHCAHMTQRLFTVPISTQRVAMSLQYVLSDVFYALLHAPDTLLHTMERALMYLARNARRAHPKRDKRKGRLKLGLEPVFMNP